MVLKKANKIEMQWRNGCKYMVMFSNNVMISNAKCCCNSQLYWLKRPDKAVPRVTKAYARY